MRRIVTLVSLAFFGLIGCTDNQPVDKTGQSSPPAQTTTETGTAARARDMSEADRALAQRVKNTLRQNSSLASVAENIQVYANNGEVTLRGSVNNEQEKVNIGAAAGQVAGVSKVNNQIEISSASR